MSRHTKQTWWDCQTLRHWPNKWRWPQKRRQPHKWRQPKKWRRSQRKRRPRKWRQAQKWRLLQAGKLSEKRGSLKNILKMKKKMSTTSLQRMYQARAYHSYSFRFLLNTLLITHSSFLLCSESSPLSLDVSASLGTSSAFVFFFLLIWRTASTTSLSLSTSPTGIHSSYVNYFLTCFQLSHSVCHPGGYQDRFCRHLCQPLASPCNLPSFSLSCIQVG